MKSITRDIRVNSHDIKEATLKFNHRASYQWKKLHRTFVTSKIIIKEVPNTISFTINYIKMNDWFASQ